jgi:hypothetical protein
MDGRCWVCFCCAVIFILLVPPVGAFALNSHDYLRVAVECPVDRESGVLWAVDENKEGRQVKLSAHYLSGRLEQIITSFGEAGKPFVEEFRLDRATASETGELPLFEAFEHTATELLRMFCNADAESKAIYNSQLAANREMLQRAAGQR